MEPDERIGSPYGVGSDLSSLGTCSSVGFFLGSGDSGDFDCERSVYVGPPSAPDAVGGIGLLFMILGGVGMFSAANAGSILYLLISLGGVVFGGLLMGLHAIWDAALKRRFWRDGRV